MHAVFEQILELIFLKVIDKQNTGMYSHTMSRKQQRNALHALLHHRPHSDETLFKNTANFCTVMISPIILLNAVNIKQYSEKQSQCVLIIDCFKNDTGSQHDPWISFFIML